MGTVLLLPALQAHHRPSDYIENPMTIENPSDLRITENDDGYFDISINENGDFENDDSMDTILRRAIYARRRADESQIAIPENREGWIGNLYAQYEDGSRLWVIIAQARITQSVINKMKSEIENSLKFLIDFEVVDGVSVEILTNGISASVGITLTRGLDLTNFYYPLLDNTGRQ